MKHSIYLALAKIVFYTCMDWLLWAFYRMESRNWNMRTALTSAMLISVLWLTGCASGGGENPHVHPLLRPLAALIHHHSEVTSPMDGPTCPMYPSCAAYGKRSLEEGSFLGLFLLMDRLFFREVGNLADKYMIAPTSLSQAHRYFDPVSDTLPLLDERRPSLWREDFQRKGDSTFP